MMRIAWKSLLNRKGTALLSLISIILCVALMLGVERLRAGLRESFARTVSGVDLIVGARTGAVNLLLYTVFHTGDAINTMRYQSWRQIAEDERVAWSIPISLGDSHRGFRVVGSNNDLFDHYRYADNRALEFSSGAGFATPFDMVLGADVARQMRYNLGDRVVVAHGAGAVNLSQHDNLPFTVKGILKPSGTPLDRALFVPLEGLTAIHIGWETGREAKGVTPAAAAQADLTPQSITAFFLTLKRKTAIFNMEREINRLEDEPLSAILPVRALYQLWSMMSITERALGLIALFVVFISLIGMLITQLTALKLRQREMALLRSFGARPWHIFALLLLETVIISTIGIGGALLLLYTAQLLFTPLLSINGIYLPLRPPSPSEFNLLFYAWSAGLAIGLIPALNGYHKSLHRSLIV